MTGIPGPSAHDLTDSLAAALAAGNREALTALLTEDVRWGGERRGEGHECTTRDEAGDHYAGLLAAGINLRIGNLTPVSEDVFDAVMRVRSPDPEDFPPELAVRLTLRGGLICDISVLDAPETDDLDSDPDPDSAQATAVTAVRAGDVAALRQLLTDRPELAIARLADHGGRTLLLIATDWPGHLPHVAATIAALVAAGADPSAPALGAHPETPLHWAASSDDVAALDALLDAGADIEARGAVIAGGSAMADATAFAQWNAARRLLERGASTNLFEAATLGLVDEVERHLRVNAPTAETITSSFWGACHGGQVATAAVLLEHGADLGWVGYDGLTPLAAARRSGADEVVSWLEQRGAAGSS